MKTLLIVEDEKLIRQGIRAMAQRSGVPIENILECNNGEAALEIIKRQKVDVMLTDIRMPKMDGIELVKQMQGCEHIPATVAISGYDDFSYAVDMLRSGVREYILKPIERDKLAEILKKLNDELENLNRQEKTNKQMMWQQIKQLMLGTSISDEEKAAIEKHYTDEFLKEKYRICCQNTGKWARYEENKCIFVGGGVGENDIFIVPDENIQQLLTNELQNGYVGISSAYQGIRSLSAAYEEALEMRRQAFIRSRDKIFFDEYSKDADHVPENLIQEARKLISDNAKLQRVHLVGTQRTEELIKSFDGLFFVAQKGYISPEQFENSIKGFLEDVGITYRNLFLQEDSTLAECRDEVMVIWDEDHIDAYREKLMYFVLMLQEKLGNQEEISKSTQKMQTAIEYMEEHYAENLNMAVVSNYISMNYSLFSYSFKQHTGINFVNYLKDIRMREAKKLLSNTDMRIIEISQKVGYDNEKHFMKLFKSTYGISPTEYRKNMNR